nr:CDS-10 [Gordionus sp. m RMFG-2023]
MVLFEFVLTQGSLLVGMSFYTLLERSILGSAQIRKGPNKVLVMGLVQPFMDAIKLFSKGMFMYTYTWWHLWMAAPVLSLGLYLVLFEFVLTQGSFALMNDYPLLVFIMLMGVSVYFLIMGGWLSNSKFSMLGGMRAVSQAVSYELIMSFIFLLMGLVVMSYEFEEFMTPMNMYGYMFMYLLVSFLICSLAEMNRTPFDLMEGESELVSGFNVEFYSGFFALIFMAEYISIMLFSLLVSVMWLSQVVKMTAVMSFMVIIGFSSLFSLMFLFIRASYPRVRYDKLMKFSWGELLPYIMIMSLWILMVW